MKKNSTPNLNKEMKPKREFQPKQSTLDFIMGFAAAYESPKVFKNKLPGLILN